MYMGFLSKKTLLFVYNVLSNNTDSPESQGATQKISALRYLFALDRFYKENGRNCDTKSEDKNLYVSYVGEVVKLSDDTYTSNFHAGLYSEQDYKVGSNFFSVNAVKDSLVNPAITVDFPRRNKDGELFTIKDGVLLRDVKLFKHIDKYLLSNEAKIAFALWLIRDLMLNDIEYESVRKTLLKKYSEELVDALLPDKLVFRRFCEENKLDNSSESEAIIGRSDIMNMFSKNNAEEGELLEKNTNKEKSNQKTHLFALRTKPFLLLAGISGTGKSRIVRELAFKSCPKKLQDADCTTPGNYCMIEVKPNWHDSTELLGYYSNISKKYVFTKFVKFLVKAMMFPDVPFFVCLDEMNLAPVEQYFAEFLSVLETRKKVEEHIVSGALVDKQFFNDLANVGGSGYHNIKTNKEVYQKLWETTDSEGIDPKAAASDSLLTVGLTLPDNVFVIGTVNMDDTTHQFSRKVIDRAMTIEMNGGDLMEMFGGSAALDYMPENEELPIDKFRPCYVTADEVLVAHSDCAEQIKEQCVGKLQGINTVLKGTPFEVSYRVLNELVIYLGNLLDEKGYSGDGNDEEFNNIVQKAFDAITLMKILPRVEGDDEMFDLKNDSQNRLQKLQTLFGEESGSGKKLQEMNDRLEKMQFTRFWP